MNYLGSMNSKELKQELKKEKELLRELERDAFLSREQIKHLEICIKIEEEKEKENGKN